MITNKSMDTFMKILRNNLIWLQVLPIEKNNLYNIFQMEFSGQIFQTVET